MSGRATVMPAAFAAPYGGKVSMTVSKRDIAIELCHKLQQMGLHFVVAGGAARDVALDIEPKDFDIIVYGMPGPVEDIVDTMYQVDTVACRVSRDLELAHDFMPSYHDEREGGDFGTRLYGVIKVGPVDIIFSKCGSWSQVLSEFDFNLNQFYFPSSIPRYSGQYNRDPGEFMAYPYKPSLGADDVQWYPALASLVSSYDDLLTLRVTRADASDSRIAYMKAKHEEYMPQLLRYVQRMPSSLGGKA